MRSRLRPAATTDALPRVPSDSGVPAVNVLIWLSVKVSPPALQRSSELLVELEADVLRPAAYYQPILKLAAPVAGGFALTRAGLYPVAGR